MKPIVPALLAALLSAALLAGCGGDGGPAADIARIEQVETDASAAQVDVSALQMEVEALQAELVALMEALSMRADDAPPDTPASVDDAIASLQVQVAVLIEAIAGPTAPLITLGGERSALSASDRAALTRAVIAELRTPYDHDGDASLVNLPDISGVGTRRNAATRDVRLASNPSGRDGTVPIVGGRGGFLKHTFRRTGTAVDLTSPGDVATLRLGRLLRVDDVELMSFSLRETDKIMAPVRSDSNGMSNLAGAYITTATLQSDGTATWHVVPITGGGGGGRTIVSTYAGGAWVEEYGGTDIDGGPLNPGDAVAKVILPNGGTTEYRVAADLVSYRLVTLPALAGELPVTRLARNQGAYRTNRTRIAQHTARGYGAWLEDSFFAAYTIRAENDAFGGRDELAYKIAWGGRTADSEPATSLSGLGESATWKGLMVGHDLDAARGPTYGDRLQGNATLTARVTPGVLGSSRVMDVSLTNIINAAGEVSRVPELRWQDVGVRGALPSDTAAVTFSRGSEIMGRFYDNGNEVIGQFRKSDVVGVFGAVEAGRAP